MHLMCVVRTEDGESVGVLVLAPKRFASGKAGYFGQGKLTIGGQRFQCQAQAVAIGEKGVAHGATVQNEAG